MADTNPRHPSSYGQSYPPDGTPTPSLAGTAETMTARITDYLASGGLFNPELANHDAVRDLLIDCREALAASQQEVERLQQREREALDAHAASFGALAAISRLTALGGEVDEYDDVTKAVEASLAAAREDSARLDWLDAQRPNATVGDALAVWGGNTVSLFAPFGRTLNHQPALARADTFREAIDAARPHATPETDNG